MVRYAGSKTDSECVNVLGNQVLVSLFVIFCVVCRESMLPLKLKRKVEWQVFLVMWNSLAKISKPFLYLGFDMQKLLDERNRNGWPHRVHRPHSYLYSHVERSTNRHFARWYNSRTILHGGRCLLTSLILLSECSRTIV